MKLFKNILFIAILSIPVYYTVKIMNANEDKSWQTYYKSPEGTNVHQTTYKEKKKARIISDSFTKDKKREPASIPRPRDKKTNREVLGKIDKNTLFENKPNSNWKKIYADELLSKLGPDSKVFIKKNLGIIRVIAGKATYIEQVQVTIQNDKDSPPNSFEAQVDAQTGKQLSVWNRTNFEDTKKDIIMKKRLVP